MRHDTRSCARRIAIRPLQQWAAVASADRLGKRITRPSCLCPPPGPFLFLLGAWQERLLVRMYLLEYSGTFFSYLLVLVFLRKRTFDEKGPGRAEPASGRVQDKSFFVFPSPSYSSSPRRPFSWGGGPENPAESTLRTPPRAPPPPLFLVLVGRSRSRLLSWRRISAPPSGGARTTPPG